MTTAEKIERIRGELDTQEAALARMQQAGDQRTSAYRSGKQRAEWLRSRIERLRAATAAPAQIAELANAISQQAEALAARANSGELTAGEFDPRANLAVARLLQNVNTLRAWVPDEDEAGPR